MYIHKHTHTHTHTHAHMHTPQESSLQEKDTKRIFTWHGWRPPLLLGSVPSLPEDSTIQLLQLAREGANHEIEAIGVSKAGCFVGGVDGLMSGMTGFAVRIRGESNNFVFMATTKV